VQRIEKRKQPVTIGIGFLCADGLIIGADSEVSADTDKRQESKIFTMNENGSSPGPTVVFAGSGWLDYVKMAVEKIKKQAIFATTGYEIEEVVEQTVLEVYRKHIRFYSGDDKPFFNLLTGIKDGDRLQLLLTSSTSIRQVYEPVCIGVGETLANYLIRRLTPQRETTEKAAHLAVQILEQVKANVPGCGGMFSEVVMLPKHGPVSRISPSNMLDIEDRGRGFMRLIKPLLLSFSDANTAEDEFEGELAVFTEECRKARQESQRRIRRSN
jgi:20S proteasome alpha/beta subunit